MYRHVRGEKPVVEYMCISSCPLKSRLRSRFGAHNDNASLSFDTIVYIFVALAVLSLARKKEPSYVVVF